MENRDQASQEKDVEWIVVDECDEEASDAPSAPAGISFIQFYYSIDEWEWMLIIISLFYFIDV